MKRILLIATFFALPLGADVVVSADGQKAAVIDALADSVVLTDLVSGQTRRYEVPETPISATFAEGALYVLSRDARKLTRIRHDETISVDVGSDSTFVRAIGNRLYVYSRMDGTLTEYSPDLRLQRTTVVGRFASDLEVDDRHAYLLFPRASEIVAISLDTFAVIDRAAVGATSVDLILEREPNALSAGTVAVADPSSKRVWRIARSDSTAGAFGRAFLRGFLGLGSSAVSSVITPTGVDRLWRAGAKSFGYDSTTHTLYRIERKNVRQIAEDIDARDIAVTPDGLAVWRDDRLVDLD